MERELSCVRLERAAWHWRASTCQTLELLQILKGADVLAEAPDVYLKLRGSLQDVRGDELTMARRHSSSGLRDSGCVLNCMLMTAFWMETQTTSTSRTSRIR